MSLKPADVKITVLKENVNEDLWKEYGINIKRCDVFKIGEEYISKGIVMPQGFCSWAWADIQRDVAILALGGTFPWIKQKGTTIAACTDGFHPVVFKLTRI